SIFPPHPTIRSTGALATLSRWTDITNISNSEAAQEAFSSEPVRWLEVDLRKSQSADFRFVSAHHPLVTAVERRQGDNPHMTTLMPVLERYKVTAASLATTTTISTISNTVFYSTTGGAAHPLYDLDRPPQGITKVVSRTENFMVVNVNGATVRLEA